MSKRGKVWLAAAGVVENSKGEWLVVKKKYGGLKGVWSLPAGFVEMGETADEAAQREVLEETGIQTKVESVIGIRTGVIKSEISDNMILFQLKAIDENAPLAIQEREISVAKWMSKKELEHSEDVSKMIPSMIQQQKRSGLHKQQLTNPGNQFQYTSYHLFL